jgi:hypothetical protein
MWSQHRQSVLVPLTSFAYETKKTRDVVWAPAVGAGTTYEVCLKKKKPRHVVWAPAVGAGTTYEVCLRNENKPRDVVWAPSVGAGTTYEVRLRHQKKTRDVVWALAVVLVPLTRFVYETKKNSWCGMSTVSRCWYHLRGSLTKQIQKTSWCDEVCLRHKENSSQEGVGTGIIIEHVLIK